MQKEKIKLEELLGIHQALHFLAQNLLPVKTFYWLNRVIKSVDIEFKELEDSRKKLIDKYATKDENGESKLTADKKAYEFEPEKRVEFEKEFAELGKEEIEISIYKFSPNQFGDTKIPKVIMDILEERFIKDEVPEV